MATSFPGAVDAFPRPGPETNTDDPGFELDVLLDHLSDALEAVEGFVLDPPDSGGGGDAWTYQVVTDMWENSGSAFVNIPGLTLTDLPNGGTYEIKALIVGFGGDLASVAMGIGLDASSGGFHAEISVHEGNYAAPQVRSMSGILMSVLSSAGMSGERPAGMIRGTYKPNGATNSLAVTVNGNPGTELYAILPGSFIAYRRVL